MVKSPPPSLSIYLFFFFHIFLLIFRFRSLLFVVEIRKDFSSSSSFFFACLLHIFFSSFIMHYFYVIRKNVISRHASLPRASVRSRPMETLVYPGGHEGIGDKLTPEKTQGWYTVLICVLQFILCRESKGSSPTTLTTTGSKGNEIEMNTVAKCSLTKYIPQLYWHPRYAFVVS